MATWKCDNCGAMTTGEHQPDACPECGHESFSQYTIGHSRSQRLAEALTQVVRSAVPGLSGSVDTRRARVVLVAVVVVAALPMLAVADLDGDRLSTHEELQQSASTAGQLNPMQKQPPAFVAVYRNLTAAGQDQLVAAYYDDGTLTTEERAQLRFLAALSQARLRTIAADQTLHTFDFDDDGGLNWGERDIGSDPFTENPRIAAVAGYVPVGELSDRHTVQILETAYRNPHNIYPQVEQYVANNLSGEVTAEDANAVLDRDDDGLLEFKEQAIGTNPSDKDTDKDRLLDGWEYAGGVRINGTYHDLPGADPMHKDLYVVIIPVDGEIPQEEIAEMKQDFDEAPVKNPDGTNGIDVHTEWDRQFAEKYGPFDGKQGIGNEFARKVAKHHPAVGTHYIMGLMSSDEHEDWAGWAVGDYITFVDPEYQVRDNLDNVANEELSHLLAGKLDEDHRSPNDKFHPDEGTMHIGNPVIASEVSRDGYASWQETGDDWQLVYNGTAS